jgi:hypothetical protein
MRIRAAKTPGLPTASLTDLIFCVLCVLAVQYSVPLLAQMGGRG